MQYSIAWDPTLKKIQSAVVEAVSPDKIILFGSRARGQAALHSDYDLLVIKDDIQNEREIARKINYRADRKTHLLMVASDLKPVHYGGFSYLSMSKQQFFEVPYRLLHEDIDQAVDIVVVSTDTWNRNVDKNWMIYKKIAEEGVTLYG